MSAIEDIRNFLDRPRSPDRGYVAAKRAVDNLEALVRAATAVRDTLPPPDYFLNSGLERHLVERHMACLDALLPALRACGYMTSGDGSR